MKKTKKHPQLILTIHIEFQCGHCGTENKKQVLCNLKNKGMVPPHIIKGVSVNKWQCSKCGADNHAKRVVYGPLRSC